MSAVAVRAEAGSLATADRLFAVLTDWPRHSEWMPLTSAEGGHGVGADVIGRTGAGPVAMVDTMVITKWVPGRLVHVRHTGRVVKGEAFFEVVPLPGDGSRVVWAERIDLPLGVLGRAGWIAAGPAIRAAMGLGLRRLARLAEEPGPGTAP